MIVGPGVGPPPNLDMEYSDGMVGIRFPEDCLGSLPLVQFQKGSAFFTDATILDAATPTICFLEPRRTTRET